MHLIRAFVCSLLAISSTEAFDIRLGQPRTLGQARQELEQKKASRLTKRDTDPSLLYPAYNLSVPIDHFHNESKYEPHSDGTFNLRYWFDASHYKEGGPVIVLQSGEADGSERLPFLQKGLLAQLAQATNGIGVVLEHRYYGTSFPVPDLSTKNFRFLTTQQAMADEAFFAQNVKFPGLDECGDLTSKTTPYISYGGSYAGAFSAFLRVQYPDVFWGSISSSGVVEAIYDYWQYYDALGHSAPQDCVTAQKSLTNVLDNIYFHKNNTDLPAEIKTTFGFENVTWQNDFTNALINGLGYWQSLNWDPAVSSPLVYEYCDNISSTEVLYPATEKARSNVTHIISEGGYGNTPSLINQMLNMIGWFNLTLVSQCEGTQDECFSTHNQTYYDLTSIEDANYKSWPYQYCTEWGFIQTGNVPEGELPLISRTLDLEYNTIICRDAFGINSPPDVELANKYGGYNISYPRLAIIDGAWDPWRPATPHGFGYGAHNRTSTTEDPYILIAEAVHHWDENGVFPNQTTATLPPQRIKDVQSQELAFVKAWLEEYQSQKQQHGGWNWGGWGSWSGWGQKGGWGSGWADSTTNDLK